MPEKQGLAPPLTEEGVGDKNPAANKQKENSPDVLPSTPTENTTNDNKETKSATRAPNKTGNLQEGSAGNKLIGIPRVLFTKIAKVECNIYIDLISY